MAVHPAPPAPLLLALLGVIAGVSIPGCLEPTPFDNDPSVTDQTRSNLEALAARGAPPMPFRFVALGDSHDEYDDLAQTVQSINARDDVEFVLVLGDMTDRGLLREYEWTHEVLAGLEVPFLTVIGNHDALSDGATIYQKMYGPLDYSFEFGGVEFVLFNSNSLEFPATAPNREWLTERNAGSAAPRGIVWATHHDVVAPNDLPGGTSAEFYAQLLRSGRIVLVLHSHLEEFELSEFGAVPVLQTGTYQVLRTHAIVTVDRDHIAFERCRFDVCDVIEAPNVPPFAESQ